MQQRKISVIADAPPVHQKEIAEILARHITGGDPVGYIARLTEMEQAEIKVKQGKAAVSEDE